MARAMHPAGMERRTAPITWQRKPLDNLSHAELRQALDEALALLARHRSTVGQGAEFASGLMTGLVTGAILSMAAVALAHFI